MVFCDFDDEHKKSEGYPCMHTCWSNQTRLCCRVFGARRALWCSSHLQGWTRIRSVTTRQQTRGRLRKHKNRNIRVHNAAGTLNLTTFVFFFSLCGRTVARFTSFSSLRPRRRSECVQHGPLAWFCKSRSWSDYPRRLESRAATALGTRQ